MLATKRSGQASFYIFLSLANAMPRGGSGHGSSGRTKSHIYTDRPMNGPSSDGDGVVAQKTTSSPDFAEATSGPEVASASLLELELETHDIHVVDFTYI